MQRPLLALFASLTLVAAATAATVVTVSPDSMIPGPEIPADFAGVSCETRAILPNGDGDYYFWPGNKWLISTYKQLGIANLRIGGNSADDPNIDVPGPKDIDQLYGFARAAGVKVIYTLRAKGQTDAKNVLPIAQYITAHYDDLTTCFAVGNEPNIYFKEYSDYRHLFQTYVAAITAVAPQARFCGPSSTPGKNMWPGELVKDVGPQGHLNLVTQHAYPGGNGKIQPDAAKARDKLLAPTIDNSYVNFSKPFVPEAQGAGLPFRLEESNSYFHGGAPGASDSYASCLWGLDFMRWWAAHGAAGINFHTGDSNNPDQPMPHGSYSLFWTSRTGYTIHPLGYAMKAFALGGQGRNIPMKVSTRDGVNLVAYGVMADDGNSLTVTLINREHGAAPRDATVELVVGQSYSHGQFLYLAGAKQDLSALSGVTLGGAPIGDDATWKGTWTALPNPAIQGQFSVSVPYSTAAIVRLSR